MIISADKVAMMPEFENFSKSYLKEKLDAAELMIRAYTNNNFQNRFVRFLAESQSDTLALVPKFLKIDDTVQISQSKANDGLYTITEIGSDFIRVDRELYEYPMNLVTKVEYPADVKAGVLNLLKWEVKYRDKAGIQSETLSRHSVTYFNQDGENQAMGYPVSLLGFLKPYKKARF